MLNIARIMFSNKELSIEKKPQISLLEEKILT